MYHPHTACRACGYASPVAPDGIKANATPERLSPVLDLGIQPLANDFCQGNEERAGYAPLAVLYCPRCSLAQLSVTVRPDILYRDYPYVTSPSATMREHFAAIVTDILDEQDPGSVVEIGSNDGLFLAYLSDHAFGNLVGIDPATNLAESAAKVGIVTVNDFISVESATKAKDVAGEVDLVVARHVFCHLNDWRGFIKAIEALSSSSTLVCIEVPYVVDQLNAGSFDQVYHEHLSFTGVKPFKHLLKDTLFHLHRVCHYPVHGGCIMLMLRRNDSPEAPHPSVQRYLNTENVTRQDWTKFAEKSKQQINDLREQVRSLRKQGKRICGYGASAKATVWINACGFTRHDIEFVCDSTKYKVYRTVPGTDIPIAHEGDHFVSACDYVILFAWNYAEEIMRREAGYGHHGFEWIVPVLQPELAK